MISEFLKSHTGIIILSIIWGLGLATFFKKSCEGGNCNVIEYKGPSTREAKQVWDYGDNKCYKLRPKIVDCNVI